MNNWGKTTICAVVTGMALTAVILFSSREQSKNSSSASEEQFTIVLDKDSGFTSDGSTATAFTENDNPIAFEYTNYQPARGKWGKLLAGGTLANATAISGMVSISISSSSDLSNIHVWWSWDSWELAADARLDSQDGVFVFEDESPSYFKIENTGNDPITIDSVAIVYTCIASGIPISRQLSFTNLGQSYEVAGLLIETESIIIPSVYEGLPVTSIGSGAFSDCSSLTSVSIPNSVTSIGGGAFAGCSSLSSISIPDSVASIGRDAFAGCSSLSSISIPDSVTSIGDYAFDWCSSLVSVSIPASVTSIGNYAFRNCSSLETIEVMEDNPVYDSRGGCNAIIETVTNTLVAGCSSTVVPNSVISIGDLAFYGCSSLSSISIPDSVASIGSSAFEGCSSLSSIFIPNSVTSIGSRAFYECSSLVSVSIPASVTSIANYAFSRCSSLSSLSIPDSVTSIGSCAFQGCSSLSSVSIPASVTSIGGYAFYECSSLVSVSIPASVASIGSCAFPNSESLTVFCQRQEKPSGWPSNWAGGSRTTVIWGANLPETTENVGGFVIGLDPWELRYYLRSVTDSSSKVDICLENWENLWISEGFITDLTLDYLRIGPCVSKICSGAFQNCRVNTMIVNASVETIDASAFSNLAILNEYNEIYFEGTIEQWNSIGYAGFSALGIDLLFYSENYQAPDGDTYYWHYDADGETPIVWE